MCDILMLIFLFEFLSEMDIRDVIMFDIASALLELKFLVCDVEFVIILLFCFE